jgi:hypothetical protein
LRNVISDGTLSSLVLAVFARRMSNEVASVIAANIAKLPELLSRRQT